MFVNISNRMLTYERKQRPSSKTLCYNLLNINSNSFVNKIKNFLLNIFKKISYFFYKTSFRNLNLEAMKLKI